MIRLEYLLRLTYGTPMVTTRVSAVGLVEIIPIGHQHWCVVGDWIKSWMEIFHSEMKLVRCAEYLLRLTLKTLVVTTRVSILGRVTIILIGHQDSNVFFLRLDNKP